MSLSHHSVYLLHQGSMLRMAVGSALWSAALCDNGGGDEDSGQVLGHPIIVISKRVARVAIIVNKGLQRDAAVHHALDADTKILADVFGQRRVVCRRHWVTRLDREWDRNERFGAVELGHERVALGRGGVRRWA